MGKMTKYTGYINQWNKTHTRLVVIRFNIDKEKELLARLDAKGKAPYIKRLIKEDIAKECYNKEGN